MDGTFDAIVQPLDFHLDAQEGAVSWMELRRLRKIADDLRSGVEVGVLEHGGKIVGVPSGKVGRSRIAGCLIGHGITSPAVPGSGRSSSARWELFGPSSEAASEEQETPDRQCAAHIIVERSNFLLPLLEYAAAIDETTLDEFYRGESQSRYLHLLDHDVNSGIFVPVEFETPFYYRSTLVPTHVSIGSGVRLSMELQSLNRRLRIDLAQRMNAMKEFVHAQSAELADRQDDVEFWVKLAFIVLCKLVEVSLDRRLPIIFR